jgi:GNAT superfamily N-acetyltransferase
MVRIAQPEDLELVMGLVSKFLETTDYKDMADMKKIEELVLHFLTAPKEDKIILLYEDYGFIAGMVGPFPYGRQKVATEMAWWVEPTKRGKKAGSALLEAFEFWGKKLNCDFVSMSCLDDKVAKFYEKSNYKLYERTYIKGL